MAISASNSLNHLHGLMPAVSAAPAAQRPELPGNFQQLLINSFEQVNQLDHQAQNNIEARLLGDNITSAEVYTSLRKAEMALKMMTQVRNKMIDAFQEIQQMRM